LICTAAPRANQWVQVDLLRPVKVTGVVTQGRPRGDEWISRFTISYGNTSSSLQTIQNRGRNRVSFVLFIIFDQVIGL